ncbi:MAG: MoxR family ATPase [Saprospiraceae bacterium]|nr:MoxR family ATPase [Saprospiraceae bacterium]
MNKSSVKNLRAPSGYIPDPGLMAAANVAIKLEMPLLLTGEPGTGKTLFAKYIASVEKMETIHKFVSHTNSAYTDLFYTYDAIGHFRESQKTDIPSAEVEKRFVHFNALGKAIQENKRSVVLIDEIDKAPRDFPNDLLEAIEELSFKVPELNNKTFAFSAEKNPLIIITSNSEKDLPSAFLRRVVFYHIPFPDEELLIKIVNKRVFDDDSNMNASTVSKIAKHFFEIRDIEGLYKKPATAEFLAWATYLKTENFDFSKIEDKNDPILKASYSILGKSHSDLKKIVNL